MPHSKKSSKEIKRDTPGLQAIRRGAQSRVAFKAGIIGGGKACYDLLGLLSDEKFNKLNIEILGVADPNPAAPGIIRAKNMGIFVTSDFRHLYSLPGLNLLIELTGSDHIREKMIRTKPLHISSIDHRGARLLWDMIQIEAERQILERESEKRLKQFLESTHDIICIKDIEGRYLYMNRMACKYAGITSEKAIGKKDSDIFPKRIAAAMAAHDGEVIKHEKTIIYKERMRIKDKVHHFHTVRFPIFNEHGKMTSFAILARDMTEEINLQEQLSSHKEYLENILTHSSDMIITTNLQDEIVMFNPAAERMLGYTKDEAIGLNVENLWKAPSERKKLMVEVRKKGGVTNYPAVLIAKDGHEVEISLSLSLLKDSKNNIVGTVGISKDMTEENRLRKLLIDRERMAAVGETVAGITHCMKNVLNGLKGGEYMVNVGLKHNDRALLMEGWESVQKGIERISRLALDMLSYCKSRAPNLILTNPLQLAKDTVALVSKSAEQKGIKIICQGDNIPSAKLDPDSMGRALLNLITNAIEACEEKTYPPDEDPVVHVLVKQNGNSLLFIIQDNGVGMKKEVREKIFTRFFSTKGSHGTGLGLCAAAKIVDEHGGTIDVKTLPGKGTTFTIRLHS
ncbi:MAG: PAS domain S-box protein [Deltaproteobacteria bacterium]|nr:PAS domain S-box protein [Deltaproteobacteria bacterium]